MSGRAVVDVLNAASVVIFDADNTLRRTLVQDQPCPHAPGEWELMPNVVHALREVSWDRVRFAIASNQDHVGYGLLSYEMAERLLHDVAALATEGRAREPIIRFCAHRLDEPCSCRKPAPGLLLDIVRTARIEPSEALFVGDSAIDEAAARAARVRFYWAQDVFGWR